MKHYQPINTHPYTIHFSFTQPPPPRPTLFPYTTLFRSQPEQAPLLRRVGGNLAPPDRDAEPVLRIDIGRSEEHTSELQSRPHLVCRLLLEKKYRVCV